MGGTDESENLVDLTPEEHYVAHQLLIKMYPEHKGLVWAAHLMTMHSSNNRSKNKLYGWIKRKNQKIARTRIGKKNGSYGKIWCYDPVTLECKKINEEKIPPGWVRGRIMDKESRKIVCNHCSKTFFKTHSRDRKKYCSKECRNNFNSAKKEDISRKKANKSWLEYKNGNFASPHEFCMKTSYYNTNQYMYQSWLKYVSEYKDTRCTKVYGRVAESGLLHQS